MSLFGRAEVAGLSGREWSGWLQLSDSGDNFDEKSLLLLTRGPYQKAIAADVSSLLEGCRRWLGSLPRRESDIQTIQNRWRAEDDTF